ncbi:MAG TPA: OmpA family protein [Gemmatimonadaceae bacterium]|nr:OmpA family protein [Gemmatimonadaceae bacterium]
MTNRTAVLSLVVAASVGMAGCRRQPAAPAPAPTPAPDNSAQARADSIAAAQRRADSLAAARAADARDAAARAQATQAELTGILAARVYFDYDRDALRDDAMATLDQKAAVLQANPGVTMVITGHTDERGSDEYNLALGQRRAAQVKRYLVSKGIDGARLTTQSMGESQPAVQGSDEGAYQQNRRAEFEARNAGSLVRPRA